MPPPSRAPWPGKRKESERELRPDSFLERVNDLNGASNAAHTDINKKTAERQLLTAGVEGVDTLDDICHRKSYLLGFFQ